MLTVSVEEAQARLPSLIERVSQGEVIVITRGQQPVARLVSPPPSGSQPVFGSCRGKLVILAEDDDHLGDFALSTQESPRTAGGSAGVPSIVESWLEEVRQLHGQILSRRGTLPDSAPLIGEDRSRDG